MVRPHYKSYECSPRVLIFKGEHYIVISKCESRVFNHRKGGPTLLFLKVGHVVTIIKGGAAL